MNAIWDAAEAPEDALEPALKLVVEAMGACAGAICLYDVRQCILRLTTEVGLSDEGCQHLRTVRRADPACWDIPLHGLLNRRAYLVESASRNRYVPKLVPNRTPVTSVICIPLFGGMTPLASIILVSAAPRIFQQRDIETLWEPIKGLTKIIGEIRKRATVSAPSGDIAPVAPAQIERTALAAERDHLLSELAARRTEGERLSTSLEEQVATIAKLRTELETVLSERSRLKEDLANRPVVAGGDETLLARITEVEGERDEIRAALQQAEAGRVELEQRESELEAAREAAEREVEGIREELRTAREEVAEANARARTADDGRLALEAEIVTLSASVEALETTLASEREQHSNEAEHTAEAVREEAEQVLDALRTENSELQSKVTESEGRVAAATSETARVTEQLADVEQSRAKVEAQLGELRGDHDDAAARIAKLDEELTVARSERDQARQAEQTRGGELAELRESAVALSTERDTLAERVRGLEIVEASAGADEERRTALERALAEERDARAALDGEVLELQARLDAAAAAQAETEANNAKLHEEIEQLRATCEQLRSDRGDGAEPGAVAIEQLRDFDEAPSTVVMGTEAIPDPTEDETDEVTVISVPPEPLEPMVESGTTPLIVVIDGDDRWKDIDLGEQRIYVAPPDTDAAAAVAALDPARVVANLSAGVINTLGALRKAGCTARFWGCVADGQRDRGVALGMIEPVIPPLDPDVAIGKLGPYAVRGSRLVTVGADVDALMSLRQALARRQVSVSMAWDGAQAMDLIQQAKPDAAVVDLDLPKGDGYAIVTRALAQLDPVPYTLLVGGRARSGKAFARALDALDDGQATVDLQTLLTTLGSTEPALPNADSRKQEKVPFGHAGRRGRNRD